MGKLHSEALVVTCSAHIFDYGCMLAYIHQHLAKGMGKAVFTYYRYMTCPLIAPGDQV